MNRRLLRTTYHAEVEEVNFTHGLPDWLNETLTGSSTASTADYTDLYGSHYAMVARGRAGDGVTLRGAPLSTSVVKVLELEAVGVTVAGPAELTLGLGSYPEGNSAIQLGAVPGDAGVAEEGRVGGFSCGTETRSRTEGSDIVVLLVGLIQMVRGSSSPKAATGRFPATGR